MRERAGTHFKAVDQSEAVQSSLFTKWDKSLCLCRKKYPSFVKSESVTVSERIKVLRFGCKCHSKDLLHERRSNASPRT